MIMKNLKKNKILFYLGASHIAVSIILLIYLPFNNIEVLGINSIFKPLKFSLSIWIYSWSMALILNHLDDKRKVEIYSWTAVIVMCFEQMAITYQALHGQLSHFNRSTTFGIILFSMMGVFILTITLWTAYITYLLFKQKKYDLPPTIILSIKIGLVYFVIFSLMGGYISGLSGHTIGANDGSQGIWFLNWSRFFGDLRVAHFFGIHSLQVIPICGFVAHRCFDKSQSIIIVKLFAILYLAFVLFTFIQAILGNSFA